MLSLVKTALLLVAVGCFAAGTVLVAFRKKRPGGYWMVAGVVLFVSEFVYYVFIRSPLAIVTWSPLRDAVDNLAPVVPFALFGIGLMRLTLSLHATRLEFSNEPKDD